MKHFITIAFFFFSFLSVQGQLALQGPTNVCLDGTFSYTFDDSVGCNNNSQRWIFDIEVVGGTIVDYTSVNGTVVPVGSSTYQLIVDRRPLHDACDIEFTTQAQVLACAYQVVLFETAWINSFNVTWDENICSPKIYIKKRDQFRLTWFWVNCETDDDTLEVELGTTPVSTTDPNIFLPDNVCPPDCDNTVTICASSCHSRPNGYEFSVNYGPYYFSRKCTKVPWQPNAQGKMHVCVKEITNCGVSAEVCKDIELSEPEIIGPTHPVGCFATYYLQYDGYSPCFASISPLTVTWQAWSASGTPNVQPIDGLGAIVWFPKNGHYTLQVCYQGFCGEQICIRKEIYVEDCDGGFVGGNITEGDDGGSNTENRSFKLNPVSFSIVNNLVTRGEEIRILGQIQNDNTLLLSDSNGQMQSLDYDIGDNSATVKTSDLVAGMYFLSDGYTTVKFVVQ